jgi:murein DD-endopeptidase MepM/ murein hydrolase activator NlpD
VNKQKYLHSFAARAILSAVFIVVVVVPIEVEYPYVMTSGATLSSALKRLNVSSQVVHQIVEAAKPVSDLTKVFPGLRFQVLRTGEGSEDVVGFKFRFSAVESLELAKVNEQWTAKKKTEPTETRLVHFEGTVTSSLWESAEAAKMDPNLISEMAEIFAFEVDFAREVKANDTWTLSVEEKLVKGQHFAWGSVKNSDFINAGTKHSAVLFELNGEKIGYFAPDGSNLKKMFLKSPIKYGRISSRFNRARFHPILQVSRPHLGVDYAAPVGTPIRAVGSGVITTAAWVGGAGKMIRIRHNGVYETAYKHLSRFASGIRNGSRVQQGDVIGYVGNTGLSTGPHLHYEFYISGRFVYPMSQKFPSGEAIPENLMKQFQALLTTLNRSHDRVPADVTRAAMK